MLHTPRLCIDARSIADFPARALVAQELIDQLVAANGEEGASSEWIEKRRVVLLSHPKQVFSGQLKRYDTLVGSSNTPLHWLWDLRFAKNANITALHRFRPADRLPPSNTLPTYTTLLPATRNLPFFVPSRPQNHYIVPCERDRDRLETKYRVPAENITVVRPSVRRSVFFNEKPRNIPEGSLLFLLGGPLGGRDLTRLMSILERMFPNLPRKIYSVRGREDFSPLRWTQNLQGVKACFYLNSTAFDWATLALETFFWGIPTIFPEENATLSELLPDSPLKLSRLLIDQPDLASLAKMTEEARRKLFTAGAFEPLGYAKQYRETYRRIPGAAYDEPEPIIAPCMELT